MPLPVAPIGNPCGPVGSCLLPCCPCPAIWPASVRSVAAGWHASSGTSHAVVRAPVNRNPFSLPRTGLRPQGAFFGWQYERFHHPASPGPKNMWAPTQPQVVRPRRAGAGTREPQGGAEGWVGRGKSKRGEEKGGAALSSAQNWGGWGFAEQEHEGVCRRCCNASLRLSLCERGPLGEGGACG